MLKRYGPSIIFGVAILSLALLVAWWSVFLDRSIRERRFLVLADMQTRLTLTAHLLGEQQSPPPPPGIYPQDPQLEILILSAPPAHESGILPLTPLHPGFGLHIRRSILDAVQKDFESKRLMLVGETSVLALVVVLCLFFLYKMIRLERRAMMELEEFRGRITHEIKTPITGLKAFLQSLKNGAVGGADLPVLVDLALRQVETQEQLAQNLLAGSLARNGRMELEPVALIPFLDHYFDQHPLQFSGAVVQRQLNRRVNEGLQVAADASALKIILDNLVDNALKYGLPPVRLEVELKVRGKKLNLDVRDNGPGIPAGAGEAIFEAYKHLDGELPVAKRGSGMGLHISRALARKMGGDLLALNPPNYQGAFFRIILNVITDKNQYS